MQNHPIYINLFGTGVRYWLCELDQYVYEKMLAVQLQRDTHWENLLFDFDFLKRFGFKHWSEMAVDKESVGLLLDSMNRVEIKQGHRIISRFQASELTGGDTLFQIHNTINKRLVIHPIEEKKRFILMQIEKGLMGKFQINTDAFSVHALLYETRSIQHMKWLDVIHYKDAIIPPKKDDSVAISSLVMWE